MVYFIIPVNRDQVNVYDVLIAIIDAIQGLCYRLVDVLLWPETIAVFLEREFILGHQHLANRLLEPPVHYRRNPQ